MFLFPFDTDASAKHHPWVTIAFIVFNFAVFFLVDDTDPYILRFGDGLHPWQWITSVFVHSGFWHVTMNMMFLWVFGLIVEGQTGSLRFAVLYLSIAGLCGLVEQTVFLGETLRAGSLGASSVLFGTMTIAVLWAPVSRVKLFFWFWIHVSVIEVKTRTVALGYLALNLVYAAIWITNGHGWATSEVLHLIGAAVGLPLGFLFLKQGWTESYGADWLTLRAEKGSPTPIHRTPTTPRDAAEYETDVRDSTEFLREALDAGDARGAWQIHIDFESSHGAWPLAEPELRDLILGLIKDGEAPRSSGYVTEYLARFPDGDPAVRLFRARQLIESERRPQAALRILGTITTNPGTPQSKEHERLRLAADALKASGVLELDLDE